jgi:hypothetical protein
MNEDDDFEPDAKAMLTDEERRAIASLKRLAKRWPESLWLFSGSGMLCVMRAGPNGEHVHTANGGIDPNFHLDTIDISNDGGDW